MRIRYTLICIMAVLTVFAQKPLVVSSASIFQDMAQNIGGDAFDYQMIVPVGGDPHLHEPTPRDARMVGAADLILVNGLTFEGWINELIANSGTRAQVVTITKGVDILTSETYKNSSDPHAWMTANNGRQYIKNIKDALIALQPNVTEQINKNFEDYDLALKDLDVYIKAQLETIPVQQRILITSHDAFSYFGKYYGITNDAILGVSTDAEIQTSDIIRINKLIRDKKIPSIFVESTINPKVMNQIAQDNNVVIGGKLYADSLGPKESPGGTYIKMLRHNTDAIVSGLTGKGLAPQTNDQERDNAKSSIWVYLILGLVLIGGLLLAMMKLSKN